MGNKAIFIEDKGGKRWQGRITRVDYLTFTQASARGSTPTGSKAFFTLFSIRIPFFILSHHSTPLSLLYRLDKRLGFQTPDDSHLERETNQDNTTIISNKHINLGCNLVCLASLFISSP